jgi:glycosyltransferase involved in cell wall biosynthesis
MPCIGSAVGGFKELLASEDLVRPADVSGLSAKIGFVLSYPARLERMVRRNIQTAGKYRSEELNRRRIAHYRRLKEVTEAYISSKKR